MEDSPSTSVTLSTSQTDGNINCYVHAVSPVKKAQASEKKYFNCMLQLPGCEAHRAVCFSPKKQPELKTFEKVKTPVCMQNYTSKPGITGEEEIIIQRFTKFTPLNNSDVDFTHNEMLAASGLIPNISSLEKVAPEQLLSLKAHVLQISPVKQIQTQNQGNLKKQEIILADPTSWIKLVLWQQYIDTLKEGMTYTLNNLRLKKFNNDRYLNTAKGEVLKFQETEKFVEPLIQPDQPLNMTSTTPVCKVLGIQQATKQFCCVSCSKKVMKLEDSTLVQCTH